MNYLTITVKGESYDLKAHTAAKIEAERILGFSLADALEKASQSSVISVVLWAALQWKNNGMKLRDVYYLIDNMESNGFSMNGNDYDSFGIEEKALLALEILKVSGFFTKAQIAELDRTVEENTIPAAKNPRTKTKELAD